jgi:arylsulfatase
MMAASVRVGALKAHFSTQPHHGMDASLLDQAPRKAPMIIDLRADPFESAPLESSYYDDWLVRLRKAGSCAGILNC